MTRVNSITLAIGGQTFHALAQGPEDGALVLCLHGFPDIPRGFEGVLSAVAGRGARAVAPYLRGYAPSPTAGAADAESLGRDVVAMADALTAGGTGKVALVGHDIGALAAYAAMAAAPSRFACAVTMAVPHPAAFVTNLWRSPKQVWRSRYMARFQGCDAARAVAADDFAYIDELWARWSPSLVTDVAYRAEVKRCMAASMPAPLSFYRSLVRPPGAAVGRARRAFGRDFRIVVPTLYLHGRDDGCIGVAMMAGQARHFRGPFEQEIVDGAGHFLALEQREWVTARVVSWLARYGVLP